MFSVLSPGLWLGVVLLCAAMAGSGYFKGRTDGKQEERNVWIEAKAKADAEVRRLEQRRQDRANEAAALAAQREARIRGDAVRARNERDGLRDDLDSVKRHASTSAAAAADAIGALSDVFQQCSRRYSELAEAADRHASDAMTCRQAWPD